MKPLTGCSKSADTDKIQGNQPMKGGTPVRTLYMRDHATDRQPATVIHDENNQAAYLLAGKWGLRQDALSLYNMRGDLLAEVSQLSLGSCPSSPSMSTPKSRCRWQIPGFVREVVYIRGLIGSLSAMPSPITTASSRAATRSLPWNPPLRPVPLLAITINHLQDEPLAILVACVLNHWAKRPDPSRCAANSSGAPKLNRPVNGHDPPRLSLAKIT